MLVTGELTFSYHTTTGFRFPEVRCMAGDALLITGASGKGKTTLLHLLAGMLKPASGSIHIGDTDITRLGSKRLDRFRGRHIGIVFQQPHFVASLTILENIILAQYLSGRKKDEAAAKRLLTGLDMAGQLHNKPFRLSVGQQQRASVARALINEPVVLLADEPTSSLDDDNCISVAALLQQQARQFNTALVVVTHDARLKNIFNHSIHLA